MIGTGAVFYSVETTAVNDTKGATADFDKIQTAALLDKIMSAAEIHWYYTSNDFYIIDSC